MRKREFTDPRIAESFIHCTCGGNEFMIQVVAAIPASDPGTGKEPQVLRAVKCRKCGLVTEYSGAGEDFVPSLCECHSRYFHVLEREEEDTPGLWTICTACNNLEGN